MTLSIELIKICGSLLITGIRSGLFGENYYPLNSNGNNYYTNINKTNYLFFTKVSYSLRKRYNTDPNFIFYHNEYFLKPVIITSDGKVIL